MLKSFQAHPSSVLIYKLVTDDFDGDGIKNRWEFMMNLNPCTPQSYGCLNDSELDYDADGIPNGEDEFPMCNFNDSGQWQTDCI